MSARPRSLSASATRSTTCRGIARLMSPASLDEAVDEVELAGAPRQVVRVDRDAVAADARSGRELHEPERLGGGRADDLPDVEVHPLAQEGELVDEGDVDVAEDVLEELGHLGGVRATDSSTTSSLIRPAALPPDASASAVVAPTRRGTPFDALAGSPGFTRSGAIGQVEVSAGDAGRSPRAPPGTDRSSFPGRSWTGG